MIEIARNEVRSEGFILKPCGYVPGFFDCDKEDLNEFFTQDQLNYEEQLLAKTYVLLPEGGNESYPKAMISFCNDAIQVETFEIRKDFDKIRKELPWGKRFRSLPAVKIARLGVQKEYQRDGVGTHLLNMTKLLFLSENRTGCRYLTVDAYITKRAVEFYKKNQFRFMKKEQEADYNSRFSDPGFEMEDSDDTVSMYYNLKQTRE